MRLNLSGGANMLINHLAIRLINCATCADLLECLDSDDYVNSSSPFHLTLQLVNYDKTIHLRRHVQKDHKVGLNPPSLPAECEFCEGVKTNKNAGIRSSHISENTS